MTAETPRGDARVAPPGDGRARAPVLRPEFGPTLPVLARRRLGISAPAAVAAVLLVGALLTGAALLAAREDRALLRHEGEPAFTLLYTREVVRAVRSRGDELTRLEARRGGLRSSLTVRTLPDSELPFGALPLYAQAHIAALGDVEVLEEGADRVWGQPAYRIEYRATGIAGQDVLVFPDDVGLDGGVVVSRRDAVPNRRLGPADRDLLEEIRRAQRSFQFGRDRR